MNTNNYSSAEKIEQLQNLKSTCSACHVHQKCLYGCGTDACHHKLLRYYKQKNTK
jgi:hypothetical protein